MAGRGLNQDLKDHLVDLENNSKIKVHLIELDILDFHSHKLFFDSITNKPIGVISFIGLTDNQVSSCSNIEDKKVIINTNFLGIVNLMEIFINDFKKRSIPGWVMAVSSIAAERGGIRNNIYACSKAALNTYLEGKRTSLKSYNIKVITIILGIVDTRMIRGVSYPKWLISKPNSVARAMYKAQQSSIQIAFVPRYWRFLMFIVRHLPVRIYLTLIKN